MDGSVTASVVPAAMGSFEADRFETDPELVVIRT
jgi:hypothetical protein